MVSALEVGVALCGLLLVFQFFPWKRKKQDYPPGPKGYPIIGNLFDMPSGDEVFVWAKWREQWGAHLSITLLCVLMLD